MREQWENLTALCAPLLEWYDRRGRKLPWREDPTPYETWVSEIMLQQTRVTAVIPYYERFLAEAPDVKALAALPEERLLKLWEGLGYYSRARNLQRAAKVLVQERNGELPRGVAALKKLPGIGDYTAAAIASIHFGAAAPAVDGNLLRVAARTALCARDVSAAETKRYIRDRLAEAIDPERPGAWNQAMMDLGATVCLPGGAPLCEGCPVRFFCGARREGLSNTLPVRGEKRPRRAEERTVFLLTRGETLAVRRRDDKGLLARMMEFPNVEGNLDEASARVTLSRWGFTARRLNACGTAAHIFTHVEWQMKGFCAEVEGDGPEDFRFVDAAAFETLAIPAAFRTYTAQARRLLWGEENGPQQAEKR